MIRNIKNSIRKEFLLPNKNSNQIKLLENLYFRINKPRAQKIITNKERQ